LCITVEIIVMCALIARRGEERVKRVSIIICFKTIAAID